MRLHTLLCGGLFAACLPQSVAAQSVAAQDTDLRGYTPGDPAMNAAIAKAQATLPLFLCETTDDDGYGPPDAFVKVAVPIAKTSNIENEIIWVGPYRAQSGDAFVGLLANMPNWIAGKTQGDQISFTYDMIVDWSWASPEGAQYGDYTTRVIYRDIGSPEALVTLKGFAVPPAPDSWVCD